MSNRGMTLPVHRLNNYDIGKIVTILENEEDGSRTETSGTLSSIKRKYNADGEVTRMEIRLSGNDADLRNGMAFILNAEEVKGYKFLFMVTNV